MRIIISGGGTGGHVFPAIAIADAIKEKKPDAEVLFVGAKGKLEMEKVPKAGYPIEGLWISGFARKLTLKNMLFPVKLVSSLWKASQIVRRFKPDAAVGVGGYASGPLLNRATARGIPSLIQEQNSYAGVTNKLLAKRVQKICVAYEGMERFFPQDKIILTGNPVRRAFHDAAMDKKEARRKLGMEIDRPMVLVFGGSLGARSLNEAVAASTNRLLMQENFSMIWQVGKLYFGEYRNNPLAKHPGVRIKAFIDDMVTAYCAADIVVCRAGALTISELQVMEKPSILIPSPNVAEDHQTKNAKALADRGAALLIKDNQAKERLGKSMLRLLHDKEKQKSLSKEIAKMKKADAAIKIAAEIIDMIP